MNNFCDNYILSTKSPKLNLNPKFSKHKLPDFSEKLASVDTVNTLLDLAEKLIH